MNPLALARRILGQNIKRTATAGMIRFFQPELLQQQDIVRGTGDNLGGAVGGGIGGGLGGLPIGLD